MKLIDSDKAYGILDKFFSTIQKNNYVANQAMIDEAWNAWCELPIAYDTDRRNMVEQVKELRELADNVDYKMYRWNDYMRVLNEAADTIEALSAKLQAVDCDGRWIYCGDGENMPEKDGWYMATYQIASSEKFSHELYFDGENWVEEDIKKDFGVQPTVFAWQPLPEPYKTKN